VRGRGLCDLPGMMMSRCPNCHRPGLVRAEHVIRDRDCWTLYCCGGCRHSWEQPEENSVRNAAEPERDARVGRVLRTRLADG
jgi:hypothetical protein